MFDRYAWKFLDDMGTKYGGVVRFHDMLGVRIFPVGDSPADSVFQSEGLYVFDPLALNHVVLKDQDAYPDVNYVRAYVFLRGPTVGWQILTGVLLSGIAKYSLVQAYSLHKVCTFV